MENIRVYRNINTVDKLFGLEMADGAVLLLAFFLIFMINRNGLFTNGIALALVYFGLRGLKRGKPEGYLLTLTRYVLVSRFKRVPTLEEAESR
jgi:hypothetical protein